ncbi:hypothetical protein KO488_08640 [Poseidonibacter lekithochrous]|uniref:hypothetical protein n=1 Tax=Poseidonibacter TaxID=2321187 RepID=UPI001C08640D|nr:MULTISPECIES: hypothetical protein [Poseidonibacter]MBU3014823.1 hypothetical protein [Poseidonibacter lekithochrous]MDO6828121.1 hypothetical protein [Poseidonibacter sp. 1_MG-2023]
MITLLDKTSLYNTFGVNDFGSIELAIDNMAPSMVEYYLSDLSEYSEDAYLNKSNIENSLCIGDYNLYIDYNDNIYLELDNNQNSTYETASFW